MDEYGLGVDGCRWSLFRPMPKPGYISHTTYEFSSFLKFVEDRYGLPSLTARDANATTCWIASISPRSRTRRSILQPRHCPPPPTTSLNLRFLKW